MVWEKGRVDLKFLSSSYVMWEVMVVAAERFRW